MNITYFNNNTGVSDEVVCHICKKPVLDRIDEAFYSVEINENIKFFSCVPCLYKLRAMLNVVAEDDMSKNNE